jgi:hypothetical protein
VSKLLQRLQDPVRSGVYRVRRDAEVRDATRGGELEVVAVPVGKEPIRAIAAALGFPDWFGGNWDALEDSLQDLSWRKAAGRVLLLEGAVPGDDLGILVDVLRSSAEYWSGRGRPFFAVFVDPGGALALPELFREK